MTEIKRIIFAGTPDFAVPSLAALIAAGYSICAVYTQPDRPAGRGRKLQASPVKQLALKHDIPVYQPVTLKDPEAQAQLQALNADLMVVAAYGLLLPQVVLDTPRLGCINVHASLLPRWRGAAPIHRALLAGDESSGITIMKMALGLDTGDMLLKAETPVSPEDTGQTLHDKLAASGADCLIQALQQWDNLSPEVQDETLTCYAKKLDKAEAQLDWSHSAEQLQRKIRAFNPWPVAQAEISGLSLRIWQAQVATDESDSKAAPGTLLRGNKQGLDIQTGAGVLRLLHIQQAGKRPMPVVDFLNAHPEFKI
ncbi:methionyl-tRNA formyltransferase [Candidatus Venteria ishoeyi]|uniref:Methionyl-tRNA formyltransferase n=1 Tax=Candidatus Venteria ishoeyi TaxID=1899563 RepID=A0A1H6F805_9GAMM|nr:methionyl-tRNA formyltransferase [Candidatus Venteria ishoeyi]MDM8548094.1 methionyl-tRNA formyltransferase [Candidatus Venteria ishoeyi]SEH05693.1 Methionyl-tRNA formyltransferase [Candidatus Venteria ishoeyi]